jgi:chemotaxis protein CheD
MAESEITCAEAYVQPGGSLLVKEPTIIRTLLGSCVGITFYCSRLGIGAMCHPMLPAYPHKSKTTLTVALGRRYVDYAIRDLVRQFDNLGARRAEIEVKLFGGGDVLLVSKDASRPTVGRLNAEAALRVLEGEGLRIVASSLGGGVGINIHFNTGTGEVLLKRHT